MQFNLNIGKKAKWSLVGLGIFLLGSAMQGIWANPDSDIVPGPAIVGIILAMCGLLLVGVMLVVQILEDFQENSQEESEDD